MCKTLNTERPAWGPASRRLILALLVANAGLFLGRPRPVWSQRGAPSPTRLTVLVPASLGTVMPRATAVWTRGREVKVDLAVDATSRLASQLAAGFEGDLILTADSEWMSWLEGRGLLEPNTRTEIAGNALVVVVPSGRPARPGGEDVGVLLDALRIAVAGENVPAGRYAKSALEAEGLWPLVRDRVVHAGSVRSALEWVARGDADAGIVYRTDVGVEPRVREIASFGPSVRSTILYEGALVAGGAQRQAAVDFLAFLTGPGAWAVFEEAGFVRPTLTAGPRAGAAAPLQSSPVDGTGAGERAPVPATDARTDARTDPWSAIGLSLAVGLAVVLAGLAPAVGLGWVMARHDFPGKTALGTVILTPLVLPPVVTGFLLLTVLGARSPLGRALDGVGLGIPFTFAAAVLAALVVGVPLYVMAIRGAFEAVDPRYEEVSWTLGVRRGSTFRRVTLPLALPGIAAGAVLAFARAMGEFGATVVLAGNVEGRTRTVALAVYTLLESPEGGRATWGLVLASVAVAAAALVGYETLSRRQRRRLEQG